MDDFVEQHSIYEIDLLKTDTQGFDFEVLLGAKETLKHGLVKYVLVELNFVKMYEGQGLPNDIDLFLNENNLFLVDYYEKVYKSKLIAWCTALFRRK